MKIANTTDWTRQRSQGAAENFLGDVVVDKSEMAHYGQSADSGQYERSDCNFCTRSRPENERPQNRSSPHAGADEADRRDEPVISCAIDRSLKVGASWAVLRRGATGCLIATIATQQLPVGGRMGILGRRRHRIAYAHCESANRYG